VVKEPAVDDPPYVEGRRHDDAARNLKPGPGIFHETNLAEDNFSGGGGLGGEQRACIVPVVAEEVNVDVVLVEQADYGSVQVGGGAGNDVADVGDRNVDLIAGLAFDDQRLVLPADPAGGGEPVGARGGGHNSAQQ
jgi:hypothetical protein